MATATYVTRNFELKIWSDNHYTNQPTSEWQRRRQNLSSLREAAEVSPNDAAIPWTRDSGDIHTPYVYSMPVVDEQS